MDQDKLKSTTLRKGDLSLSERRDDVFTSGQFSEAGSADLEKTIKELGRTFAAHPGFVWTDQGFEILHADWPAYPRGHGIRSTLSALVEYPIDTQFFPIDNIDQCTLFVVGHKPKQDPFGEQHLHAAIWDKDLLACALAGYVNGVHQDDDFLRFPDESMTLTARGVNVAIANELLGRAIDILGRQVLDQLYVGQYDTAVREASVHIEVELRRASGESAHGWRLVEKCFGENGVLVPSGLTNAARQTLRNSFRAYFKYVRNEFAHNFAPLDLYTACRLVRRSAELAMVIQVVNGANKGQQ